MGKHIGLADALKYPLFQALASGRPQHISSGTKSASKADLPCPFDAPSEPLAPVEEALLIAACGVTGITMPDMPLQSEDGTELLGTPMLNPRGRAGSSADNAQGTHFFLINDRGTYFLKHPPQDLKPLSFDSITETELINRSEQCRAKVLEERVCFPGRFPCHVDRTRHASNWEGSTVLFPVVDLTRQYINGLMYLLSQPEGCRPTPLDDWNFYRPAGVKKWIRSGYLNRKLRLPLGYTGTFRIHVESGLLLQNLLLTIQAMGLGAWIHSAFPASQLLGGSKAVGEFGPGLGFRFATPKVGWFRRVVRGPFTPLPAGRDNPVGLDGILEGCCPPYFQTMDAAIDAVVAQKYGQHGFYSSDSAFADIFRPGLAKKFINEAPSVSEDAIQCTRDICNYIYDTYGRFPAHVDAMFVPGVLLEARHLAMEH